MNTRLSKYWLHSLSTNDNYGTWDESLREIDYIIGSIDDSKSPLDAPKINDASAKDSTIRTVIHQIAAGTAPVDQTDDILALLKHRSDLSINDDSLFFRGRTVTVTSASRLTTTTQCTPRCNQYDPQSRTVSFLARHDKRYRKNIAWPKN